MPDRPTQHPASNSDARKRAADLAAPDWGSDLREPLVSCARCGLVDVPGVLDDMPVCRPCEEAVWRETMADLCHERARAEKAEAERDAAREALARVADEHERVAEGLKACWRVDMREAQRARSLAYAQTHDFLPVAGHPDDDECTYRSDGTDKTYCGSSAADHEHTCPATEALARVRDDIRARRREFRRLDADEQYLLALDDAYGIAANACRAALAQPATDEGADQ